MELYSYYTGMNLRLPSGLLEYTVILGLQNTAGKITGLKISR